MKKLSKANWLFLFYQVVNKSDNHWRKLEHCTIQRHKKSVVELQICQNDDVSICFSIGYYHYQGYIPTDKCIMNIIIVGIKYN